MIKMEKMKDEERILKVIGEKITSCIHGNSDKPSSRLFSRYFANKKAVANYIQIIKEKNQCKEHYTFMTIIQI